MKAPSLDLASLCLSAATPLSALHVSAPALHLQGRIGAGKTENMKKSSRTLATSEAPANSPRMGRETRLGTLGVSGSTQQSAVTLTAALWVRAT